MSRFCLGLVGFGGVIHLIVYGCACLINGALENYTDLPKIVLECATPRFNLVFSLNASIEFSVDFVRDVWVSSTWEFFVGESLDDS